MSRFNEDRIAREEDRIECTIAQRISKLNRYLVNNQITQQQYHAKIELLTQWANEQYELIGG